MSFVPGLGLVKGMALTLRRFFEPKVTVMYPEVRLDVPHKFRGRLRLLYDAPRRGTSDSRVNFVHPKDAGGVLVELVEPRASH